MAQFAGTKEEFIKYIGGYCRNKVNTITRNERLLHNKTCQHCKKTNVELESAHIGGQERNKIIGAILESYFKIHEGYYNVELSKFEDLFVEFQTPVVDHFLFLCKDCHASYDKSTNKIKATTIQKTQKANMQIEPINVSQKLDDTMFKNGFAVWLKVRQNKRPNTITQYCWAINKVIKTEGYSSWIDVAENIGQLLFDYDTYGTKGDIGNIGNKTVINALRRFKELLDEIKENS